MDIQLLVRVDDKPEKKVTVSKDVIIGRSKTCQFRVLSNDVSREHCKLIVSDEVVAIRDLGSSNGTSVNGKTIPTGIDVLLHPSTTVEVGPLRFVVNFESKHKIAPPPTVAEKASATPATEKPVADKAAVAKSKTTTKPAAATGPKAEGTKSAGATKSAAAASSAATPAKKKVAKKPAAPVAEEPAFPFAASSGEADDGPAWPDFLLGGDQSSDGPTVAHAPASEPTAPVASDEFSFGAPPTADDDEPVFDFSGGEEPTFEPGGFVDTVEAPAMATADAAESVATEPTSETVATAAQAEAIPAAEVVDDEPVFGDFTGDDDSEFAFDPAAAESAPSTPAAATPTAPQQAAPQPGKLKSLFGLFGKNKAEKPATTTTAPAKPVAAPTAPASTPAAPAVATATPSEQGNDDGLNDFLTGGGGGAGQDDDEDTPDWMKQLS